MAARIVTIKFDGDAGEYTATIDKMAERYNELTSEAEASLISIAALEPAFRQPIAQLESLPLVVPADTIRESLATLTQEERQDLYRLLHDAFGCRM